MMYLMKKENIRFDAIFQPEPEGGFTVTVPSLPGCITYGKNKKEAEAMIIDAISGYLESVNKYRDKSLIRLTILKKQNA